MNTDNGFDLMFSFSFIISPQLDVIGPKPSDILTSLTLQPGDTIAYFVYLPPSCLHKYNSGEGYNLSEKFTSWIIPMFIL